jgi:hypothetical protein
MNGRIYDPLLGRFLSADTVVQFEGDLQSYNRYTYSSNNPLSYIDPSGFTITTTEDEEFAKKIQEALQRVVGDSAEITYNEETYTVRTGFLWLNKETRTRFSIGYENEAEGALEESAVWSELKSTIDSDSNINIFHTTGSSEGEGDGRGNGSVAWNPDQQARVHVYDPNAGDNPTTIYEAIVPPEINLWHETFGHAKPGFNHHPLSLGDGDKNNFYPPSYRESDPRDAPRVWVGSDGTRNGRLRLPRDYDSDRTYDPAIRSENEAREAMREQGQEGREYWPRVHQYYPAFPGQNYLNTITFTRDR